jgi:hypothetical protein
MPARPPPALRRWRGRAAAILALAASAASCSLLLGLDEANIRQRFEDCDRIGDEDRDGASECGDAECAGVPRCRAPLAPAFAFDFPTTTSRIRFGDLDGDGAGDLAAFPFERAVVRFGSPLRPFEEEASLFYPRSFDFASPGRASFTDLDGDGRADIARADATDVYVSLGADDRRVRSPLFPFSGGVGPIRFVVMAPRSELADLSDVLRMTEGPGGTRLAFEVGSVALILGEAPGLETLADGVPVEDLDGDGSAEIALAYVGHARVFIVGREGGVPVLRETIDLPGAAIEAPLFADLDGDGRIDLVSVLEQGVAVARGQAGLLSFGPPCLHRVVVRYRDDEIDHDTLRLRAVADFDGDGIDDLVSELGILRVAGPVACPGSIVADGIWLAPDRYGAATVGDFNGDDHPDVVFSRSAGLLELVLTRGGTYDGRILVGPERLDHLRAGDLDGDLADDLAFVERSEAGDRVRVIFGDRGARLEETVATALVSEIVGLEPARLADRGEPDHASKLLVTYRAAPEDPYHRLAILRGSAGRTLYTRLDRRSGGLPETGPDVLAGHFCQLCPDCPPAIDLALVSFFGRVDILSGAEAPADDPFTNHPPLELPSVSASLSADVDGDGSDEILALSTCEPSARRCVRILTAIPNTACELDGSRFVEFDPRPMEGMTPRLAAGDVDGDRQADIIVLIGGRALALYGEAGAFDEARASLLPASYAAVALLQVDPDPGLELALATADGRILIADLEGREVSIPYELSLGPAISDVAVGDANADGIEDIVAATPRQAVLVLGVDRGGAPLERP